MAQPYTNSRFYLVQPLKIEWAGVEHTVVLTQMCDIGGAAGQEETIMDNIMLSLSPIQSFLFAADATLLHTNNKGLQMIQNAGMECAWHYATSQHFSHHVLALFRVDMLHKQHSMLAETATRRGTR